MSLFRAVSIITAGLLGRLDSAKIAAASAGLRPTGARGGLPVYSGHSAATAKARRSKRYKPNGARECARRICQRHYENQGRA